MIGLVIPDYSSNDFFHRLGNELVRADTAIATLLERIRDPQLPPRQILLAAELFG